MPYRDPVSSNGAIGFGEMPWLRAVIGTKRPVQLEEIAYEK
jgi:hypothetical protein